MRNSAEPARRISCFSSHGAVLRRFALERVRANQLAEIRGLVRRRQARLSIHHRAHLIEIHLAAQPRRRQRRLRPGQPAANHANPQGVVSADPARRFTLPPPASRLIASPLSRTFRHSSRNSAPMAR